MKKIVFLFALLFCIAPKGVSAVSSRTFTLENYTVIVEETYIDGGMGLVIEKQGSNPFQITYRTSGERYHIKGVINSNDQLILYGSAHVSGAETYYDSVFIVFDESGNFLDKVIVDYGDLEEVEKIFYLDGAFIVQTIEHKDMNDDFVYVKNHFLLYDDNFEEINRIEVSKEIMSSKLDNNYVLFTYDYDDFFEFGLNGSLNLIEHDDLLDIQENEVFKVPLFLEFINTALLNGEIISNGLLIDYPGRYDLVFNNNEYHFTYTSNLQGIEDGGVYTEGVTITFNGGLVSLNNDVITSGTHVAEPGSYQIAIAGVNGYTENYSFTITSDMDGVTNNHIYEELVAVSFNGDGYLNNQFVESPLQIEDDGDYILKIRGENNYIETYFFSLEKPNKQVSFLGFIQKFDIVILVVTLITGGIILKKK